MRSRWRLAAMLCLAGALGFAEVQHLGHESDTVMVIVAGRDLQPGVQIQEGDLYAVQMSPSSMPEGVFVAPQHVVGRIPRERILRDELVRGERLVYAREGIGLDRVLPPGKRAITVSVEDGTVWGFLNPAQPVDVLVTRADKTDTVLTEALALAVHAEAATLLVDTVQAERLVHAQNTGVLTLSLRHDCFFLEPEAEDIASLRRVHYDAPVVRSRQED